MKRRTAFHRLFSGMLVILVLFGAGSSATLLQATDKMVSAAAPPSGLTAVMTNHVLVIPAAEFRHDGYFPNAGFFTFFGGYWRGATESPCFMAPVYIPRIATIDQVFATIYDNDDIEDFWLSLYRVDNYTGDVFLVAELFSSGASTSLVGISDITIGEEGKVSYPQYSYYLGTCLPSLQHRLYNVRVWYSDYQTHLPMITR